MTEHEPSDQELMQACAEGNMSAFEQLVDRHKDHLVNFFTGMCNDRTLAEDLAQDVFIKLFKARDRYRPSGSFTSYLFTIARNHWYDYLRKEKRTPDSISLETPVGNDASGDELKGLLEDESADEPFDELSEERRKEKLHELIGRLPEEQRMVIVLSCFEHRPHEEIGEVMDVPVGTVKSRKHLAIKKLKKWADQ
jgi:RNA polymerase sigma-70 factor (ECF subfamily)